MTEHDDHDTPRWQPGDQITLRYVGHSDAIVKWKPGKLLGWPYVVVEDRPDLLALWMPAGTRMHRVDMADWSHLPPQVHGDHPYDEFRRGDVLRLMPPGARYSVWFHWSPQSPHEFLGWYVNLDSPHVRTSIGVDTTDDILDVVVMPDFQWWWKDEDQLPRWTNLEVYTPQEVEQFYVTGRAVIEDIEARRFPFDGSYLDWRPDPAWGIPEVHPHWDRVPGYDVPLTHFRPLRGVAHPPPLGES